MQMNKWHGGYICDKRLWDSTSFIGAVQGAAEANGARDTVFVGMKRSSSEADTCPSVSSIKSTRSLRLARSGMIITKANLFCNVV